MVYPRVNGVIIVSTYLMAINPATIFGVAIINNTDILDYYWHNSISQFFILDTNLYHGGNVG